jgi:hypothetical protein
MGIGFRMYIPESSAQAMHIGVMWLVLTLVFEFSLGLNTGHSWSELLSEYDITKGKLWVLIPLWVVIAPYIFYKYFLM